MIAIQCKNLDIKIGSQLILSELTLEIEQNQFIGVFGPNGSGKTTFMKAVLGVIPSASGQLKVLNTDPKKARRQIGYVPQYRDMSIFHLNGRAFVATSIRGHSLGLPFLTKQDYYEVDKALDSVQATDLKTIPLSEMSGGQRQRLLLAQALLGQPKLIILDEPFSHLDPKWTKIILSLIKDIQQQQKLTVILSTHDLNPVIHMVDQVLCIGNKKAVLGKTDDVIDSAILTDLYGFPLHVVKADHHIFVTTYF